MTTLSPAYKLWMETNGEYVFGPGVFGILVGINKTGTLKEAASGLSMSYRYAWGLIKKAEEALGEPLIHARKGEDLAVDRQNLQKQDFDSSRNSRSCRFISRTSFMIFQ